MMSLYEALNILADVHTRDDELAGFVVQMGARPEPWLHGDWRYIKAWEAVRAHIGRDVEPSAVPQVP